MRKMGPELVPVTAMMMMVPDHKGSQAARDWPSPLPRAISACHLSNTTPKHATSACSQGNTADAAATLRQLAVGTIPASSTPSQLAESTTSGLPPPPPEYLCPITQEVMRDPVMVAGSGNTYERYAIERWLSEGHITDPATNIVLSDKRCIANLALRALTRRWLEAAANVLSSMSATMPPHDNSNATSSSSSSSSPSSTGQASSPPGRQLAWLLEAAEAGLPEAQCAVGNWYWLGEGGQEPDMELAAHWFSRAAAGGDAVGRTLLGWCYHLGRGVDKSLEEAFWLWRLAADQGHSAAQGLLALCYSHGMGVKEDLGEAIPWADAAARAQDPVGIATYLYLVDNLSCSEYWSTRGKMDAKAIVPVALAKLSAGAASQDNPVAEYCMFLCYCANTSPGDEDVGGGRETWQWEWLVKSADAGYPPAQTLLGLCHEHGVGMVEDIRVAVQWYRRAAEQGLARAQVCLGHCYAYGNGVDVDLEEAVMWYWKGAQQGETRGQRNLGLCFQKGAGVGKDLAAAAVWYCKAAEGGDAEGQFLLGMCYTKGWGVKRDMEEGRKWLRRAREQGFVPPTWVRVTLGWKGAVSIISRSVKQLQLFVERNNRWNRYIFSH